MIGGQFISYLIDSAFADVSQGWRYMLGIAAIPAIIQLFGSPLSFPPLYSQIPIHLIFFIHLSLHYILIKKGADTWSFSIVDYPY